MCVHVRALPLVHVRARSYLVGWGDEYKYLTVVMQSITIGALCKRQR